MRRILFRRSGRCDRYPGVQKQRCTGRIPETAASCILMDFLERLDADWIALKETQCRFPNRKKYAGKAYADACLLVYRCLKSGCGWRTEDMRYLLHFKHPLYMLCDFAAESGCLVNEPLLLGIMRDIRCGKLDIEKYRLDERCCKAAS